MTTPAILSSVETTPLTYLTREQVAEVLQVSLATVDRLRKQGALKETRIMGSVRFHRADVEALHDR